MNRAEILGKAVNALEAATYSGVSTTGGMARVVADAVLSAIADEISDLAESIAAPETFAGGLEYGAIRDAEHLIRSMTGDPK